MPFITSDQIRDISVKAVEMFLNNKVPLSEGLAKQASALELNADQIQRAVEATNSIAYLKVLSLSNDRTVEFPLCKFAEVMAGVAVPDITKVAFYTASNVGKTTTVEDAVGLNKTASVNEEVKTSIELTDAEKYTVFVKLASVNEKELEALRDRKVTIEPQILKIASAVQKDPEGFEKLATVCDESNFSEISKIVYGEEKEYKDTGLFKTAELKEVNNLLFLIKEASELESEISEKEALAKRCEHVKQAFLGMMGKAIGSTVGKIVAAPVKALSGAVKNTANNVGQSMGNAATSASNTFKETIKPAMDPLRRYTGVRGPSLEPKPLNMSPKKKFGIGAIAGAGVTGVGFAGDALLYTPGRDKGTGRSKDVWTNLQREPF